jgi:hypothetical protein
MTSTFHVHCSTVHTRIKSKYQSIHQPMNAETKYDAYTQEYNSVIKRMKLCHLHQYGWKCTPIC